MTYSSLRTLFLASATAFIAAAGIAQAADLPAAAAAGAVAANAQATQAPVEVGAAAAAPSQGGTAVPRPGLLQGFGPLQSAPLFGGQPLQTGAGKW